MFIYMLPAYADKIFAFTEKQIENIFKSAITVTKWDSYDKRFLDAYVLSYSNRETFFMKVSISGEFFMWSNIY